jgi:hypothetical protein
MIRVAKVTPWSDLHDSPHVQLRAHEVTAQEILNRLSSVLTVHLDCLKKNTLFDPFSSADLELSEIAIVERHPA